MSLLIDDDTYFDGDTYEPAHDQVRLSGQLYDVFECMKDGVWRTLEEIQATIGKGSEAGISARLRDLRKVRFGSHTVNRRNRGDRDCGHFEYQLIVHIP